eukprot:3029497-Prymnesium_polylepis.1
MERSRSFTDLQNLPRISGPAQIDTVVGWLARSANEGRAPYSGRARSAKLQPPDWRVVAWLSLYLRLSHTVVCVHHRSLYDL